MNILLPIIVVLGIFHSIRIYLAGREARKLHPPVEYHSSSKSNAESWQWRLPSEDVELEVIDSDDESHIDFNPYLNSSDLIFASFGYLSLIGCIAILFFSLWLKFTGGIAESYRVTMGYFLGGLGFFAAIILFNLRSRITSLIRKKHSMTIIYTYGYFFRRKIVIPESSKVVVKYSEQSFTDYDVSQDKPFYNFTIKPVRWLYIRPTRFYIAAHLTQISWITGGILDYFNPQENKVDSQ